MKKVLVVDDTYIWRMTAENALKGKYTVMTAESGMNCIIMISRELVDLVLLDMEMPNMSGIETLEKLRSLSAGKDLPVIMVTGDDDKNSVIAAAKLTVQDYLTKPYSPDDLLRRVDKIFSN